MRGERNTEQINIETSECEAFEMMIDDVSQSKSRSGCCMINVL